MRTLRTVAGASALLALLAPASADHVPLALALEGPAEYRLVEGPPDLLAVPCALAGASWDAPLRGRVVLTGQEGFHEGAVTYAFASDDGACQVVRPCITVGDLVLCAGAGAFGWYNLERPGDGTYRFTGVVSNIILATERIDATLRPLV